MNIDLFVPNGISISRDVHHETDTERAMRLFWQVEADKFASDEDDQ